MFYATALVYSSHNRSPHIHRDWIVERALQSHHNKTILHLPMSMKEMHQQEYCWGNFRWYFDQFRKWGLRYMPFYWCAELRKEDVDLLFEYMSTFEVVILGGGNSPLGMQRFAELGERFYGDSNLFARILHERQNQGKLTVGFSAGACQLCEFLGHTENDKGFGLARNVIATLHHERGREGEIFELARHYPHCMVFGLPNDSGVASDQGYLDSGNIWQLLEFIVDDTWDLPQDGWHIKTRQGMKVVHYYCDGRDWIFNHGDRMVRIMSPDNSYHEAWILTHGGVIDYWSQQLTGYHSVEDILNSH